MYKSNEARTGTGDLGLDLLLLLLMIIGGTAFAVWYATSAPDIQKSVLSHTLVVVAIILMQPGIILGASIAVKSKKPLRWRLIVGSFVAVVFGGVLPYFFIHWLSAYFG